MVDGTDAALLAVRPALKTEAEALIAAVQARAAERGVALPVAPEAPVSCCGRGCTDCVWAFFYSEVRYWRDDAVLRWSA